MNAPSKPNDHPVELYAGPRDGTIEITTMREGGEFRFPIPEHERREWGCVFDLYRITSGNKAVYIGQGNY